MLHFFLILFLSDKKFMPVDNKCGYGGIGRRGGFRFRWETVQVRVLLAAVFRPDTDRITLPDFTVRFKTEHRSDFMTREQYESLPLNELKGVAKARGLKRISTLRKKELIDRMIEADEAEARSGSDTTAADSVQEEPASDLRSTNKAPGGAKVSETDGSADSEKRHETRKNRRSMNRPQENRYQNGRYQEKRSQNSRYPYGRGSDHPVQKRTAQQEFDAQKMQKYTAQQDGDIQKEQTYTAQQDSDAQKTQRTDVQELDSGSEAHGILEVLPEGYGFIRSENFLPGDDDVYVSPSQIRKFSLKTGDMLSGNTRVKSANEKFSALLYINSVNGMNPAECQRRMHFEDMTPIFPNERIHLERPGGSLAMRIVDLISPIGKGQRGMIVSPPKAGKTTLLKDTAKSILRNNPEMHLIILLIDERPEEVTDIRETVQGDNVEVIYSTFDELPDHHRRVSEMVIERAKRLVENKKDVMIFIDSITRLARAYNQVVPPSGRTLSGGLDPAALHMPKRFFGAARNMREGGSLTILATALVDTGSKMDDVVYEEFKGTGNMELVLDRKLQEKRVFPAIDIVRSGTRKEDLLLSKEELEAVNIMRRTLNRMKTEEAAENILDLFAHTRTNEDLVRMINRRKMI